MMTQTTFRVPEIPERFLKFKLHLLLIVMTQSVMRSCRLRRRRRFRLDFLLIDGVTALLTDPNRTTTVLDELKFHEDGYDSSPESNREEDRKENQEKELSRIEVVNYEHEEGKNEERNGELS